MTCCVLNKPLCVNSMHTVHQGLLHCFTLYITLFWGYTGQTLTKFLWGTACLFCKWWGTCAQTKCPLVHSPIQKSTTEITWVESPSMQKLLMPDRCQVECFYTVLFPKALYKPTIKCRQVWRLSHTLQVPGLVAFHWSAKFWYLHGSWVLIVHALHWNGAGWSWPAWELSIVISEVVNSVSFRLTGLDCFVGESGGLSGWLSVGLSASNTLSAGGIRVSWSISSSPACSRLLLMGNR